MTPKKIRLLQGGGSILRIALEAGGLSRLVTLRIPTPYWE